MKTKSAEWECQDECGMTGDAPLIHGQYEEDDYFDAPSACPKCGGKVYVYGLRGRDPWREDFHADGF